MFFLITNSRRFLASAAIALTNIGIHASMGMRIDDIPSISALSIMAVYAGISALTLPFWIMHNRNNNSHDDGRIMRQWQALLDGKEEGRPITWVGAEWNPPDPCRRDREQGPKGRLTTTSHAYV